MSIPAAQYLRKALNCARPLPLLTDLKANIEIADKIIAEDQAAIKEFRAGLDLLKTRIENTQIERARIVDQIESGRYRID